MKTLFEGLVLVHGRQDVGKTSFILGAGPKSSEYAFIDGDIKGKQIAEEFQKEAPFGMYVDLFHETRDMKEIEYYNYCMGIIDNIKEGQFDAIAWDNWTKFETTLQPYVLENMGKFRKYWSAKGDIKGAQVWQSANEYEAAIIDKILHKTRMLLISTPMKPEKINGKETGRWVPDCKKPLIEKAQMRLVLKHNPNSQAPLAIVLKRISKRYNTEEGIETISVLPRKINPGTWKHIRWYWDNPVGDRELTADELPNKWELAQIEGTLTEDELKILQITPVYEEDAIAGDKVENGFSENDPENIVKVKQMKEDGMGLLQIAEAIGTKVPIVIKMLKK
jgi:hypothetical protein